MDDQTFDDHPPEPVPMAAAASPLTTPATRNLVTARTLGCALAILGIDWSPVTFDQILTSEAGLYAWVIGGCDANPDVIDRPVAYLGVGRSIDGGLRKRLLDEKRWIEESAEHVHGRAMFRLDAQPVGAPVYQIPGADLGWLDGTINEHGAETLRAWLAAPTPDIVAKAEQLCIRAAAHIGDTPPPVNSQHTTAWESDAACDWGGWAAAQRLTTAKAV